MKFDGSKIRYRRATVNDAKILAGYRVIFLNEAWALGGMT